MITKFPETYDEKSGQIVKLNNDFYNKMIKYRDDIAIIADQERRLELTATAQQATFLNNLIYTVLSNLTRVSELFKTDLKLKFDTTVVNFSKQLITAKKLALNSEDPIKCGDYNSYIDFTFKNDYKRVALCKIIKINHNFELVVDYTEELRKAHVKEILTGITSEDEIKHYNTEPLKRLRILENAFKIRPTDKIRVLKNGNGYVIFTDSINYDLGLKIIGAIPILFKEWTENEDIIELFMQIGLNDVQKTFEILDNILNKLDIKKLSIKKALKNIDNLSTTYQLAQIEKNIATENNIIAQHKELAEKCYDRIKKLNQELLAVQNSNQDAREELITFITKCKNIKEVKSISSNRLDLVITSRLSNWDPEAIVCVTGTIERMKNNNELTKESSDFIQWLLIKILKDETLTIEFWNRIAITWGSYSNPRVEASPNTYEQHLPNPHLYHYNCWGLNIDATLDALSKQKYDLALTQIIATIGMLNLYDTAVVKAFIKDLTYVFSNNTITYDNATFIDTKTNEQIPLKNIKELYNKELENGTTN